MRENNRLKSFFEEDENPRQIAHGKTRKDGGGGEREACDRTVAKRCVSMLDFLSKKAKKKTYF